MCYNHFRINSVRKETKMMHYAFKFRLYPNKQQREYFENTFGACRFMWNKLLEDSMNNYKLTGKLCLNTPAMYKSDYT